MPDMTSHREQVIPSGAERSQQLSREGIAWADSVLFLRAYWKLIHFDRYLAKGEFVKLRKAVCICRPNRSGLGQADIDRILHAVDMACIWYWKEVLCLQRSATLACLLKEGGVAAQLIVGVQQLPFKAHAWVEVNGQAVSDKPYMRDLYTVLDAF
jgi:hypothetical protein